MEILGLPIFVFEKKKKTVTTIRVISRYVPNSNHLCSLLHQLS